MNAIIRIIYAVGTCIYYLYMYIIGMQFKSYFQLNTLRTFKQVQYKGSGFNPMHILNMCIHRGEKKLPCSILAPFDNLNNSPAILLSYIISNIIFIILKYIFYTHSKNPGYPTILQSFSFFLAEFKKIYIIILISSPRCVTFSILRHITSRPP